MGRTCFPASSLRLSQLATWAEQQLGPQAIARLFDMAAKDHGTDAAIVILAGATARFNSCQEGFNGDLERDLALEALDADDVAAFDKLRWEAAAIVGKHWREIAAA